MQSLNGISIRKQSHCPGVRNRKSRVHRPSVVSCQQGSALPLGRDPRGSLGCSGTRAAPPPQLWAQAPSFGEGGGVGVCAAANSNLRGQIPRAGPRATPLMKPALQRRGFEARPRPAPRGPRGFLPKEVSAHLLPFVSTGGFNSESN